MSDELKFKSKIEIDYHTDRFGPDAEFDNKISADIDWQAYLDVRSWGIKDLSYMTLSNQIQFEVDIWTPSESGELDRYGSPKQDNKTETITIPVTDNMRIVYEKGWHMFPAKLEYREEKGKTEAILYVSMPCGGGDD